MSMETSATIARVGGATPSLFTYSVATVAYIDKVLSYNPMAYWPMGEALGIVAQDVSGNYFDGQYTGVTLGQDGIGDGNTCPLFDGTNDFVNVYSAGFRDAFNGAEGTLMIWWKVFNGGVWLDGSTRYPVRFEVDSNNYLAFLKSNAGITFVNWYKAGGTLEAVTEAPISPISWQCSVITWSATADAVKAYRAGSQVGSTQSTLGVWVGNVHAVRTTIGSNRTTPTNPWHGWLAHCAVWDTPLTAPQIAALAVV